MRNRLDEHATRPVIARAPAREDKPAAKLTSGTPAPPAAVEVARVAMVQVPVTVLERMIETVAAVRAEVGALRTEAPVAEETEAGSLAPAHANGSPAPPQGNGSPAPAHRNGSTPRDQGNGSTPRDPGNGSTPRDPGGLGPVPGLLREPPASSLARADGHHEACMVVLNMALNGASRTEAEAYLARHFPAQNSELITAELYKCVAGILGT